MFEPFASIDTHIDSVANGTRVQLHLRDPTTRNPGGVLGETHRHDGTATTPHEAAALQEAGVDAIVASGFEAGDIVVHSSRSAEDSLTGTLSLVPQIADTVDVPVIAAGGIGDARGVIAALALGAEAVQMGTVFLRVRNPAPAFFIARLYGEKRPGTPR